MPQKKISEFSAVTTLDGTEEFVLADSGTTKKITADDLATALGGGAGTLIEEIVVGVGGQALIDFQSIPGTFRHLRIEWMASVEASGDWYEMYFNNDTGSNYSRGAQASASSPGNQSSTSTTSIYVGYTPSVSADGAAAMASGVIDIPWYSQSTYNKTAHGQCAPGKPNSGGVTATYFAGAWNNTAAITRVTLFRAGQDTAAGSVFQLYGIP